MPEQTGLHKIQSFRQRWVTYQLLADVLIAIAVALLLGSLLHHIFLLPVWYGFLLFVLTVSALLFWHQPWKITDADVTRYLNSAYPQLEESCDLLIKAPDTLNPLQTLQRHKTEQALAGIEQPTGFTKRFKSALLICFIAALASFLAGKINYQFQSSGVFPNITSPTEKNLPPEKLLPQIQSVKVTVSPPAYTGKQAREQNNFNLNVEEDARVKWIINTNTTVTQVHFIFNEKEKINLYPADAGKTKWYAQQQLSKPGFYQVKINDKLSDYYKIEIIKDSPPLIQIKTPKQYTYIDAGESTKVPLTVIINDDYGIGEASINATIAKGSGESVKFKDQKMSFDQSFTSRQKQYQLQKTIDLKALGLEPGDELYFYIQALDTRRQQSRTDVYIISIQDTAQLLAMNQISLGANLVPEYFRSERQIILDTEKLLKDRDSISAEKFKSRCNDLGMDQKLLRLRYGKFLGEEDESNEGGSQAAEGLSAPADFSNIQKIMDAYQDKHDNAEDAGFFEKSTKTQLKNTLNEMWKAELNLRTFQPQQALPFEYKALRLLKDLQQKSRAYVAKTAFNPPPLKLVEKRLSGDLSKITPPLTREDIKKNNDVNDNLRKAVSVLDGIKQTLVVPQTGIMVLQAASLQLSAKAASQPGIYLPAITALHHILNSKSKVSLGDILKTETALQKVIPATVKLPQAIQGSADLGLSQIYYKNLTRNK